jgi:hypothetical protein
MKSISGLERIPDFSQTLEPLLPKPPNADQVAAFQDMLSEDTTSGEINEFASGKTVYHPDEDVANSIIDEAGGNGNGCPSHTPAFLPGEHGPEIFPPTHRIGHGTHHPDFNGLGPEVNPPTHRHVEHRRPHLDLNGLGPVVQPDTRIYHPNPTITVRHHDRIEFRPADPLSLDQTPASILDTGNGGLRLPEDLGNPQDIIDNLFGGQSGSGSGGLRLPVDLGDPQDIMDGLSGS